MTPDDTHSQGVRALSLAAVFQAILGAGAAAWGAVRFSESPDDQWLLSLAYLVIGAAAMLIGLPLARRARWAWRTSLGLAGALVSLPIVEMIAVYAASPEGSLHGSEGALLFLFLAMPTVLILGFLYASGRSAVEYRS